MGRIWLFPPPPKKKIIGNTENFLLAGFFPLMVLRRRIFLLDQAILSSELEEWGLYIPLDDSSFFKHLGIRSKLNPAINLT
jgi:hypothetical protein